MGNRRRRAQDSPRLRMNMDLRNSPENHSQRMLNAIEPGTPIADPPASGEFRDSGDAARQRPLELLRRPRWTDIKVIWITAMKVLKRADINNDVVSEHRRGGN